MARIDQLPEGPRHLLQTASVLGRAWPVRLLEAVWTGPQALDPLLLELQRRELLYERPGSAGSVYVFTRALLQEVAYESLLPACRQTLQAAAEQALETLEADRL